MIAEIPNPKLERWLKEIEAGSSIEEQTTRWFEAYTDLKNESDFYPCDLAMTLERLGKRVYVKVTRWPKDPTFECFTIGNVLLTKSLRGQGWFTTYLELCYQQMPLPGLIVEQVHNERLRDWFCRQGMYEQHGHNFLRRKSMPGSGRKKFTPGSGRGLSGLLPKDFNFWQPIGPLHQRTEPAPNSDIPPPLGVS